MGSEGFAALVVEENPFFNPGRGHEGRSKLLKRFEGCLRIGEEAARRGRSVLEVKLYIKAKAFDI